MRANRIPRHTRLTNRIDKLWSRMRENVKIGKGNPYYKCPECGISVPEMSRQDGHWPGCEKISLLKEINHYRRLLAEELNKPYKEIFYDEL